MTTAELLDAVRRFVADNFPGRTPRRLQIYTWEDGAEPISLPVPFALIASAASTPAPAGGGDAETTGTDDSILEALDNAEKPIKIAMIAVRAKCALNSYFRGRVRELVRRGLIQIVDTCFYWPAEKPLPGQQ